MEQYQQILKEETQKYADHYYPYFKLHFKSTNFEEHYEKCDFNEDFAKEVIFNEDYFLEQINLYERKLFEQNLEQEIFEQTSDDYIKGLIKQFLEDYKNCFKKEYEMKLKVELSDLNVELKYAIEDEAYYLNRKYEEEKEEIGGAVSEEERLSLMKKYKEEQISLKAKMKLLKQAIDSVAA